MTIEIPVMLFSGVFVLFILALLYVSNRKNFEKDNTGKPGSAIGL